MSKIDELKELKSLLDQKAINQDEFNILKSNVLASNSEQINSENNNSYSANIPVNSNKQPAVSLPVGKLAIVIIVFGFILYFAFGTSEGTSSRSNNSSSTEQGNSQMVCNRCKGTGIEICTLCGGTGENNLGMTCGCVTMYSNMIQLGHVPDHSPLQWTCTKCKGTGYSKY